MNFISLTESDYVQNIYHLGFPRRRQFFIGVFAIIFMQSFLSSIPLLNFLFTGFNQLLTSMIEGIMNGQLTQEGFVNIYIQLVNALLSSKAGVALELLGTIVSVPLIVLFVLFFEKKKLSYLSIKDPDRVCHNVMGSVLALICIGACIGLSALFGWISISVAQINGWSVALLFILFFIQSFSEELLFRGLLLNGMLLRRMKPYMALVWSSVWFALMHVGTANGNILAILNCFLVGFLLGVLAIRSGSLCMPIAFHFIWNFTESCILGTTVSGVSTIDSIFSTAFNTTMEVFSGGEFGLEGSCIVTLVLLITIALLTIRKEKKTVD